MQSATVEQHVPTPAQFESWVSSLPEHVAGVVRTHSPFVPHRLKQTGQTVWIARFQEGSDGEPSVRLSVVAPQAENPGQADDQVFESIAPSDLYSLAN